MKQGSKRKTIPPLLLLSLLSLGMISCEKQGSNSNVGSGVAVSQLSFTECHPQTYALKVMDEERIEVSRSDGVIYVNHRNLSVNCGFETVQVTVSVEGNTIRVSERGVPDNANCICSIDNSFQIVNVPRGPVTLVVETFAPEPHQQTFNI